MASLESIARVGPGLPGAPREWRAASRALLLASWLGVPAAAAAQAPLAPGRVEGLATVSRRLSTSRQRAQVYGEPGSLPARAGTRENALANVVLYLESSTPLRGPAQPGLPPVMRQHGEQFEPHVLPVLIGTTVEFPNDDDVYHSVFSLSRVRTFDLGRSPRGSSKSVQFPMPGVVQLFCHIHADMSGYILVLDNPFFVVPDASGHFALEGVPPGVYRLVAWHERIRPIGTAISVESGRTTTVRVDIPLPEPVGGR